MDVREMAIQQGIANDAAYVGRAIRDIRDPASAVFAPVVSLCMAPYFSLFVYESSRKLRLSNPSVASSLSSEVNTIVGRSRHSLKLFEDNQRWIEGQLAFFRDEVLPAHKQFFIDRPMLGLGRIFGKDLGLYSYADKPIATTHGIMFHVGIDPATFFERSGPEIRSIYEQYGRYFAGLGARLDSGEPTFVTHLSADSFNAKPIDLRAGLYYRKLFDGAANHDLNALLTVFRCMMNFVDSAFSAGIKPNSVEYTIFKIRFLTLYQVLSSLQRLHGDRSYNLTDRSVGFLEKILGTSEAQLVMDPSGKPFRNTLMHYNLDSRIELATVDVHQPLFGLASRYFPVHDAGALAATVTHSIHETAIALNEWASS